MAVLVDYNPYSLTNPGVFGDGIPVSLQGPSQEDLDAYEAWLAQQYQSEPIPDDSWMDPYEYGGWRPQDENGWDLPVDQYEDWYYNNPDAQPYIEDWWAGGDGDLSPDDGNNPPPPGDNGTPPPPGGNAPPPGYGTGYPPPPGFPSITTAEPLQMSEQDRMWAAAQGDLLDQGYRDSQNRYEDQEAMARERAWGGPGGYGSILAGEGGFSDEESGNILQEEMLRNGMATDADYDSQFLTPEEQAAMRGDPYAARDMAAGKLTYLDQWLREGDVAQRGAVSALDTDLNAAVDPAKLGLSDEYNANFQFGQGDADLMADQAGRIAGTSALARDSQLRDAAHAHGNTSPIALEAARGRNAIYGDIASADSVTDARLKARGIMLDVASQREAQRLNAERDISDRQRANASEIRQTQLATEKGISDAWNDYGRYNTNLMVDTTGQAESAASQRAGQLATNRQNVGQQNINTRFGQAGTASSALSGRYGQVYGQKKQEEAEGRGFLTGQQDRAQAGGQGDKSNRLNLYGARNSATGSATGRAIQAKNLPTLIDKAAGFAGGLLGG